MKGWVHLTVACVLLVIGVALTFAGEFYWAMVLTATALVASFWALVEFSKPRHTCDCDVRARKSRRVTRTSSDHSLAGMQRRRQRRYRR